MKKTTRLLLSVGLMTWLSLGGGFSFASDVGMVAPFLSTSCPSGWKALNSNNYFLTSDYAQLVAVLPLNTQTSGTWGRTSGGVTFSLPNLDGRFVRFTGGNASPFGVFQDDDFKSHTHVQNSHSHQWYQSSSASGGQQIYFQPLGTTGSGVAFPASGIGDISAVSAVNQNTGGAETRPVNISLLACVKVSEILGGSSVSISSVTVVGISTSAIQYISPSAEGASWYSLLFAVAVFATFLVGLKVGNK